LPTCTGTPPPKSELLRLDHPKVRGILSRLPRFVPGMPLPSIRFPSLPAGIVGVWSLWEISIITQDRQRCRMLPLFVHEDGRMLAPTARFLWEQLCLEPWCFDDAAVATIDGDAYRIIEAMANNQCRDLYLEMCQRHLRQIHVEKDKADYNFRTRRKLLQSIGLPEVRDYRLRQLAQEECQCAEDLRQQGRVLPQLTPLLMLKIS
jgi:hypothetical protein